MLRRRKKKERKRKGAKTNGPFPPSFLFCCGYYYTLMRKGGGGGRDLKGKAAVTAQLSDSRLVRLIEEAFSLFCLSPLWIILFD